jgi:AraC-like DNA-binding protein
MPSGVARSFTDPDAYARFVPSTKVQLTVAKRGQFKAKVTLVALRDLWMQRFSDNLPRVAHSAAESGRVVISFRTAPGPSLIWGGLEMTPETLLRHNEAFDSFQRSSGSAAWGSVSLPVATMANIGSMMADRELTAPRDPVSVAPSLLAMSRLHRIHTAIGRLAASEPELLAHAGAAKGMEQALIGAMVSCLIGSESHQTSRAQGRHHALMRKFHALLEANPEEPIYMPELSVALGVSGRTLRNCFQEHLGMGLKRYLLLRRLHLARHALMEGAPGKVTVTDTATRYGFWELGRFAGAYKSVFGESPSATLRGGDDELYVSNKARGDKSVSLRALTWTDAM